MSKEMREYRKMHRQHRKELIQLAKNDFEWDWEYLHNIVITKIRHMYEYYSAGNNICQSEESLNRVLYTLKHVLDLQDELDTLWEENNQCEATRETINEYTHVVRISDEDAQKIREKHEREAEIYQEIYTHIGQNLLFWWD